MKGIVINILCGVFIFLNIASAATQAYLPKFLIFVQFFLIVAYFIFILQRPRFKLLSLFSLFGFTIVFSPLFLNIFAGGFYVDEWRESVDFFLGSDEKVNLLYSLAYMAIFSFILGLQCNKTKVARPLFQTHLSLQAHVILSFCCIAIKYLISPKGFIFNYSYAYLRTTSLIEENSSIAIVEFIIALVLCFLFYDALTEVSGLKKRKMYVVMFSVFVVNVLFEFLKGERTTVGIFPAMLFLYLAFSYRNFDKRFKKGIFLGCFLFLSFLSLGVLRAGNFGDANATFETVFQSGTWLGAFYSIIGSAQDYLKGYDLKLGTTYIDYVWSIPPGFIADFFNYVRPSDTVNGNPAMWYYGKYTHGGISPTVVALLNFGILGVIVVNFLYGFLISAVERRFFEKATLFWILVYCSLVVFLLRWQWYGDIYLIRAVMVAILVYLITKFIIRMSKNRFFLARRFVTGFVILLFIFSCSSAQEEDIQGSIVKDENEVQDYINVKDFGAKGDGVHDDTHAIQEAIDFAKKQRYSSNQISEVYDGSYFGGNFKIYFPFGRYKISNSLKFYSYLNIEADKAILFPDPSFKKSEKYALAGSGWQSHIRGLQFVGFRNSIKVETDNVNSGMVIVENCSFYENDISIYLDARSALSIIKECRFIKNKRVLIQERGDKVIFEDNWVWAATLSGKSPAQIEVKWGVLHFVNNLLVPSPPSKSAFEPAWINNYGSVLVSGVKQGGEAGSFTLINNFAEGDESFKNAKVVIVKDSFCYAIFGNTPDNIAPAVVRLYGVPNQIILDGLTGLINSSLIDFSRNREKRLQAFAEKKYERKYYNISIKNITGRYRLLDSSGYLPSQLSHIGDIQLK